MLYKEVDLAAAIRIQRLQWAGNIIRMDDSRTHKKILQCQIEGRRPIGRPRNRWTDGVANNANLLLNVRRWTNVAKERIRWRHLIEETKVRHRTVRPLKKNNKKKKKNKRKKSTSLKVVG
ncbi:hypothetical protein C0J52_01622 [Blattella germanica]|nr:hypothetical protein C0J52_01622 [Blattella germanica]